VEIRIKLMGMLKDKAPPGGTLDVSEGATIEDALTALKIPVDSVQVFTINGQLVRDRARRLNTGDELSVLPPVGGG
jgi:sulfur carrier protein ThiS